MTSHPSSSKQHHDLSPGGGGSSAAPIAEKEQQSNVATSLTKSILDFPSQLFHECFRKSFVLELDRLCGLAWEISRMKDEEEDTDVDQKYHPQDKTKVLFETRIEALRLRWYKFADLYSEHTKCEDATMFLELNLRVANVTKAYELEHEAEEWLFEEVGGLVDTVWKETKEMMDGKKANRSDEGGDDFGKRESVKLVLAKAARGLHATKTMLKAHLAKESAQVLPLLKRYFSEDEQAKLIWSFLEKFPTKKVTGILEWVFREMMMMMREDEREYLESLEMYLRTPQVKTCAEAVALKSKLKKWIEEEANEEERERMRKKVEKVPILSLLFENEGKENDDNVEMTAPQQATNHSPSETTNALKRNRRNRHNKSASLSSRQKQKKIKKLPIDHIFQFHDALRVELNRIEAEFLRLPTDGVSSSDAKVVREIEGRFVFLQGVYAAHSKSEDEVVFPQLEKKKALVNVSHSYTLDHEQESELFEEMLLLIEKLKKHIHREILKEEEKMTKKKEEKEKTKVVVGKKATTRSNSGEKSEVVEGEEGEEDDSGTIVRKLQETCFALKVSLETHVNIEEDELWPIFEEHFTIEEQEELVGLIIGQTGAEVLRAMLDWVRRSLDNEEALEMMANMKQATENTRFAKWVNTWMTGEDPEAVRVLGLKRRATVREKEVEKVEKWKKIDDNNYVNKKPFVTAKKREKEREEERRQEQEQEHQKHQNNEHQPNEGKITDATNATKARVLGGHGVRQVNEYFDTKRKSQSSDKLLSTPTSVDNQSEGDDTSRDTNYNHTDTGLFKPGWSDIFKMNQRQLESAMYVLNQDDTLAPSRKAYLMQNLLASRWIAGNQKITEDKMELDAMMVSGGSKDATNKINIASTSTTDRSMRAASASAEDYSNTDDEKNILPSLQDVPNFKLRGAGDASITAKDSKKKIGDATDQLIICHPCLPPSANIKMPTTLSSFGKNTYKYENYVGCRHYHRKCKIVPACCNVPFPCRFCHDDNSDHAMDRYNTKEMQCMKCALIQPIAKKCKNCNVVMARYFCKVCNLFDDLQDGKSIYHCPFCNVCRKGKGLGQDFFHCMKCNSCVSLIMGPHECHGKKSSIESECPVCKDFMFDSETPVKTLPCGHLMHTSCFETYTCHYYTCPLCRKSLGDFTVYFRMLDAILADEQKKTSKTNAEKKEVGDYYDDDEEERRRQEKRKQRVKCNDCLEVTMADFHFVYHACRKCRSYNTVVWNE